MKVLITGITGFAGSHLAELYLKEGADVHGTIRWRSDLSNIRDFVDKLTLHNCDIRDAYSVAKTVEEVKPEFIHHLAAQTFVLESWRAPQETLSTNIMGTLNILEAARKHPCIVHFSGSSEEYGAPILPADLPIKEEQRLQPVSPYAVSKVGADMLAVQYAKSYGIKVVVTRAFNHSVSKWTPIVIREDLSGLIDIVYISEIRKAQKKGGYLSGRMDGDVQVWDMKKHHISVWNGKEWTKVNEISCHPIRNNQLIRVVNRSNCMIVTDNHSLIGDGGYPISAENLKVGDRLEKAKQANSEEIMIVDPEIAWFLGFFVAEGCITTNKIRMDNKDKNLLDKCQAILLSRFGQDSYFDSTAHTDGVYRLSLRKPRSFARWLQAQVYSSDRNKRIPRQILNCQREEKLAFLRGFNDGDGLKKGHGAAEFKNFKTKSPILASGLLYLLESVGLGDTCLNIENRNDGYYSINICSNIEGHENWGEHLKIPDNVVKEKQNIQYAEEVWDLSTDSQTFAGGVGAIIAHNTGPRRGEVFVTSTFAKQIARILAGEQESVIEHGNLESIRDFTDVRDIVRGYFFAAQYMIAGSPTAPLSRDYERFNLCSGEGRSMLQVLQMLLDIAGIKGIELHEDPKRMRPSDIPILIGSNQKARERLYWSPSIPFKKTMEDLLHYWEERV